MSIRSPSWLACIRRPSVPTKEYRVTKGGMGWQHQCWLMSRSKLTKQWLVEASGRNFLMAFYLLAAGLKWRICPKKSNPFPPIPCNPPVRRHKGFIVRLGLALFLHGLLKGNKAEARRPVGWSAKLLIFRSTCGAGATLTTQQAHKYLMFSAGRGSGKSVSKHDARHWLSHQISENWILSFLF